MANPIPFKVISRDDVPVDEVLVPEKEAREPETPETETNPEDTETQPQDESQTEDGNRDAGGEGDAEHGEGEEDTGKEQSQSQPAETPEQAFVRILEQSTGGKFKSWDEVEAALSAKPQAKEPEYKDDYIKKAVEYYNATGDLKPYLEAFSVDYSKMDDEAIMRMNLRKEYPTVSQKALDRIYHERVTKKYNLDPDENDAEDIEIGKELMAADAAKIRDESIKQQQAFKAPEVKQPEAPQQPDPEAIKAEIEKIKNTVKNDPAGKALLTDKRIVFKHDGNDFNFEVKQPENLIDMVVDDSKFWKLFIGADGKVDYNKFFRIAAIASDETAFMGGHLNHAKSQGKGEVLNKIKNTVKPTGDAPKGDRNETSMSGLIKKMAEQGRLTTN